MIKTILISCLLTITLHQAFALNRVQFELNPDVSSYLARSVMDELYHFYEGLEDYYGQESYLFQETEGLSFKAECSQSSKECIFNFTNNVTVKLPARFTSVIFELIPSYYTDSARNLIFFEGVMLFRKLNARERIFAAKVFVK